MGREKVWRSQRRVLGGREQAVQVEPLVRAWGGVTIRGPPLRLRAEQANVRKAVVPSRHSLQPSLAPAVTRPSGFARISNVSTPRDEVHLFQANSMDLLTDCLMARSGPRLMLS